MKGKNFVIVAVVLIVGMVAWDVLGPAISDAMRTGRINFSIDGTMVLGGVGLAAVIGLLEFQSYGRVCGFVFAGLNIIYWGPLSMGMSALLRSRGAISGSTTVLQWSQLIAMIASSVIVILLLLLPSVSKLFTVHIVTADKSGKPTLPSK